MLNSELLAIMYGLASAATWGTGDFSGGFATKTSNVSGVLLLAGIFETAGNTFLNQNCGKLL
jgi:hypothetical protein